MGDKTNRTDMTYWRRYGMQDGGRMANGEWGEAKKCYLRGRRGRMIRRRSEAGSGMIS